MGKMNKALKTCVRCIIVIFAMNNSSAALPPSIETYLRDERNSVTEDNFLPDTLPGSLDFVRSVTANWRTVLNEMPQLAPDGRQQAVIVVAAEFLPPKEYLAFVNGLCDLRLQGRVLPGALRSVLWANMVKSGFLAYNYDHAEVGPLVARLRSQLSKDYPGEWEIFFDDLISGKMKARLVERRIREGYRMPEEVAYYDDTPYRQLSGGSVIADVKFIVKSPVVAVASLASKNRTRWSMIGAIVLVIGAMIGLSLLLLKAKRR